jgi:PKD repeat protein
LTINPSSGSTVLSNGVPVTGLAATTGNKLNYTMVVPAGATNLKFTISGGTGDADLYVKFGAAPTLSSYDCRPYVSGNSESCPIATAQAGTYYVMLNAYASFTGVTLTGSYTAPGSGGTPTANFTFTMSGLTATFTDTSTDSGGTIGSHSWTFGDGATSTAASPSHTYASANTYSVTETVTDSVNGTSSSKTSSITISVSGNVLTNGVPVTGLSGSNGTLSAAYTLTVPAGKTSVTIKISGGTGDADLYVKLNAAPTLSSYDCRPYISGNSETCTFTPPAGGGTYYVKLNAYATYSGVSLTGSYSP